MKDDTTFVESFLAQGRVSIPDDGFAQRVMAALPQRSEASHVRRLRTAINVASIAASIIALTYLIPNFPFSTSLSWDGLELWGWTLMEQVVLFLRRLHGLLPSVQQLVALIAVLAILSMSALPQRQTKRLYQNA